MGMQLMQTGGGAANPSGSANQVYATPDGTSGSNSNRALVANDLPTVPPSKGGVCNVSSTGVGKVILPACDGDYSSLLNNTSPGFALSNTVRAYQFNLDRAITVNKVVLDLSVATGSAGSKAFIGVYDSTGATLLIEAAFDATSATVQSVTLGASVVLAPGTYYMAFGSNAASGTITCRAGFAILASWFSLMTKNKARGDTSSNTIASGHLPSTLGTVSTAGGGANIPFALLET
jgi:hypothetical protein